MPSYPVVVGPDGVRRPQGLGDVKGTGASIGSTFYLRDDSAKFSVDPNYTSNPTADPIVNLYGDPGLTVPARWLACVIVGRNFLF